MLFAYSPIARSAANIPAEAMLFNDILFHLVLSDEYKVEIICCVLL